MIEIHHHAVLSAPMAFALYRFRYRVFIEHAGWKLPCRGRLESDQFDTGKAVHLVCREPQGRVIGLLRLLPTTSPYMIQTLWPRLLQDLTPPVAPDIWEVTRLGVDPSLSPRQRGSTVAKLVTACIEFGLSHGIAQMLAVMSEDYAEKIVRRLGWDYEPCGTVQAVGDDQVMAVRLTPSPAALASVRRRTHSLDSVHTATPMAGVHRSTNQLGQVGVGP